MQALADTVLVLHLLVVLFVVGGLVVLPFAWRLGWRWAASRAFRITHLGAIVFIVAQSWAGQWCPLTLLESWLRQQAGAAGYARSFIETWVSRVLFYEAPFWAFTVAYTVFGLLVLAAWRVFPPRLPRS
jgi:hypothetical protein